MCSSALKRQKDGPGSLENYSSRLNVSAHLGLASGHPRIRGGMLAFSLFNPPLFFPNTFYSLTKKLAYTRDEALNMGGKKKKQIILGYELPCSWDCWTAVAKMNNKRLTRGL